MEGKNELTLCPAMVRQIFEEYLNDRVFKNDHAVVVTEAKALHDPDDARAPLAIVLTLGPKPDDE